MSRSPPALYGIGLMLDCFSRKSSAMKKRRLDIHAGSPPGTLLLPRQTSFHCDALNQAVPDRPSALSLQSNLKPMPFTKVAVVVRM